MRTKVGQTVWLMLTDSAGTVMDLIDEIGFDTVDGGTIAESWRQQPGPPGYCKDYDIEGARQALTEPHEERAPEWRTTPNSPGTCGIPRVRSTTAPGAFAVAPIVTLTRGTALAGGDAGAGTGQALRTFWNLTMRETLPLTFTNLFLAIGCCFVVATMMVPLMRKAARTAPSADAH